jgi:hypothetical protein
MTETAELTGPLVAMLKEAGVFALRMNSGTVRKGKYWIKLHDSGTADILCFPPRKPPVWIETKRGKTNKEQAEAQARFRDRVEAIGHIYVRVTSIDEALKAIQ